METEKRTLKEIFYNTFLVAIIGFVAGGLSYYQLTKLEESGGTMEVNQLFAFLYENFGKDVTVGFFLLVGVGFAIKGIIDIIRR